MDELFVRDGELVGFFLTFQGNTVKLPLKDGHRECFDTRYGALYTDYTVTPQRFD